MGEWFKKWEDFPKKVFEGTKGSGIFTQRVLWLGVIGVLLLVFSNFFDGKSAQKADEGARNAQGAQPRAALSKNAAGNYGEEILEEKLSQVLSKVKGAGKVAVSITYAGGARQEHAKNKTKETKIVEEKDTGGGVRTTSESKENEQVLMTKENGADHPVTVTSTRPAVQGVLIVAEGAADSAVKANLMKAVETGLGIASCKITVLPQAR